MGGVVALRLGYHWLFVIDALTSFGAAIMLYYYLPKQQTERNRHKNTVLKDHSTSAYRDIRYLFFILLVALYGIGFFQIFATIPQYFNRVCNYNEEVIGLLLALNGLLVVVIEMPLMAVLQKRKNIFSFIITGALFIAFALGILKFGHGLILWSVMYIVIITASEIFAMPFMMNFSLSRPLKERQGQYSALYSISFGIATFAAPSLGLGLAGKYGFDSTFDFFIVLSLAVAIGFWLLNRTAEIK
ncbi:MAG: MFS transporter [Chitinophagales bacterium]|nr:MFS transporter [Chitinophagales bacterium]